MIRGLIPVMPESGPLPLVLHLVVETAHSGPGNSDIWAELLWMWAPRQQWSAWLAASQALHCWPVLSPGETVFKVERWSSYTPDGAAMCPWY